VREARPGVEIETIEILEHLSAIIRDRVRMIPLIIIDDQRWYHAPALDEILAIVDRDA
jgi:hypothetical protein